MPSKDVLSKSLLDSDSEEPKTIVTYEIKHTGRNKGEPRRK